MSAIRYIFLLENLFIKVKLTFPIKNIICFLVWTCLTFHKMSRLHRPCYKAYISGSVFDITVYAFSLHSCVFIFVSFIFNRTWSVRFSSIIIVWRERNNFINYSVWFLLWAGFDHVTNKVHLSTEFLFFDAVGPLTKKKLSLLIIIF